jgi:epoxyqueuosine reductase
MVLDAGFVRARFIAGAACSAFRRLDARSILVAALPYGNRHEPAPDTPGTIAPFARRNYYREGVARLRRIGKTLRAGYGGRKSDFRILCNSQVPEKPLAIAGGLGALGRNGLVITPEAGSLFVIAAMTLPFDLDGDPPETAPFTSCAACSPPRCVAACPTGAVRGDGTIDIHRCIQWYASGNGSEVPEPVLRRWGNRLYGCTDCQDCCIHNRRPVTGVSTERGALPPFIDPRTILAMTDADIVRLFKGTCMGLSWLGPRNIRRNARSLRLF